VGFFSKINNLRLISLPQKSANQCVKIIGISGLIARKMFTLT